MKLLFEISNNCALVFKNFLPFISNNATLLLTITTSLLALVVAIMTFFETKELFYRRRYNRFLLAHKSLANDSPKICEQVTEFYRKKYKKNTDSIKVSNLIYLDNWVIKEGKKLIHTDLIELVADYRIDRKKNYTKVLKHFKRKNILPAGKNTLEENMALFLDRKMYDNPSFAFSGCEVSDGKIKLLVQGGTYFDFVNTCFCFSFETAYRLLFGKTGINKFKIDLRKRFELMEYNNRFAQIGVVTLVVFLNVKSKTEGFENYFLLHKRSDTVAESQNLYNAVPSGSFQPVQQFFDKESFIKVLGEESISNTIIREFGEELLSIEEFSELSDNDQLKSISLLEELKKNIYYLGMGFNPIYSYLEVITIAAIDMNNSCSIDFFGEATDAKIEDKIKANIEGKVTLKKFNMKTLDHYSKVYLAAPALKEIITIILKDFEGITNEISNRAAGIFREQDS